MAYNHRQSIGLFGGTFNPIHLGHLRAAEEAIAVFKLDLVLFIPSFIPPHKVSSQVAPAPDRLRMVELALAGRPEFLASDIEVSSEDKSYSIYTVRKIRKKYSDALIFFLIGIDAFMEIETWHKYELILKECRFIVMSRPNYDLESAKEVLAGRLKNKIYKIQARENVNELLISQHKIFLLEITALDISSTEVRNRACQRLSLEKLVPPSVEKYIQEKKLYSG